MTLLLVVLVILLVFGLPQWPYWGDRSYGYGPSGVVAILLFILILWLLVGGHR